MFQYLILSKKSFAGNIKLIIGRTKLYKLSILYGGLVSLISKLNKSPEIFHIFVHVINGFSLFFKSSYYRMKYLQN